MSTATSGRAAAWLAAIALTATLAAAACGSAATQAPGTAATPSASPAASASSSPAASASSGAPASASVTPSASTGTSPEASASASSGSAASLPPLDCATLVRTPAQTEGPYFTPGSPEKPDLREPGMPGTTLVVSGYVVTADCAPLADAKIDIWQADSAGTYDNSGYTLRGHVFSAADGTYSFTTIVPGIYPGRTEHIHVTVTPAGGARLTTQLYFPGVAQNDSDGIFDPAGLLTIIETADGLAGRYDFVL